MAAAYLPPEIVRDILVRLPAKSLLRFKSVCKPWRAIISDPDFVKAHLNDLCFNGTTTDNTISSNLICFDKEDLHSLSLISFTDREEIIKLDNPLKEEDHDHEDPRRRRRYVEFYGSCNGLLLLSTQDKTLLWNPCTQECNIISKKARTESCLELNCDYSIFGLGYDSSSDEYKGVTAFRTSPVGCHPGVVTSEQIAVSVCTSKTRSWGWDDNLKYISDLPFTICGTHTRAAVTVNGSPHWLVYRIPNGYPYDKAIMRFDCTDERFEEVQCPDSFTRYSSFDVSVLGGSLCVVVNDRGYSSEYDVWVMKEYGVKQSWTQLFQISLQVPNLQPVGLKKNGQVLIVMGRSGMCGMELLSYNLKTGREEDRIFSWSNRAAAYVESLASPYGFTRKRASSEESTEAREET